MHAQKIYEINARLFIKSDREDKERERETGKGGERAEEEERGGGTPPTRGFVIIIVESCGLRGGAVGGIIFDESDGILSTWGGGER